MYSLSSNEIKQLTEGSFCFGRDLDGWTAIRKFVADVPHHDGAVLDIGCANGFFLWCILQWSSYNLIPYGIDVEKELILKAQKLFPELGDHFESTSFENFIQSHSRTYDFIYWNVWTDYNPSKSVLMRLLEYLNHDGRLILAFYDSEEQNNAKILPIASMIAEGGLSFNIMQCFGQPHKAIWLSKM